MSDCGQEPRCDTARSAEKTAFELSRRGGDMR